jgi:hypothetical protein
VELFYEGKIDNAQLGKHRGEGVYLLLERISDLRKNSSHFRLVKKVGGKAAASEKARHTFLCMLSL